MIKTIAAIAVGSTLLIGAGAALDSEETAPSYGTNHGTCPEHYKYIPKHDNCLWQRTGPRVPVDQYGVPAERP